MTNPVEQITKVFTTTRPAFMPYFTLGYPNYETSLEVVQACAEAGADLMELGMPFSDPLADGPTIQHSTQVALENGMTTAKCLGAVRELRSRGVEIPFMLMGYYNPILAYGMERFVGEAAEAGANGFIIPDLPPEEAAGFQAACRAHGLALSYLLAPNSPDERIERVTAEATGFVYLVSVMGITGARTGLPPGLAAFVARVRRRTRLPLAVGFGISTPEQAAGVGAVADGVIVGSALVKKVGAAAREGGDPAGTARSFVARMKQGLGG